MIYDNIKLEEQKFNSTHFNNNPNYSIIIDNDLQTIKSPERKVSHLSSTKHHTFRFFKIQPEHKYKNKYKCNIER